MRKFALLTIAALAAACGEDMGMDDAFRDPSGGLPMGGIYDPGEYQRGEKYARVGENPWVDTEEDAQATFGVDVDTASYVLMRRDLRKGYLPVPHGVRTEEYLNYFDYGYEGPAAESEDAFAVHLDAAPSPFGPEGSQLLRVALQGKRVPEKEREQASLVFLVDTSGSMDAEAKLPLVRSSLLLLLDQLRADDRVAIVTYAGSAGTLLAPTPVAEREKIEGAIRGMRAAGSTYGEGGIHAAYKAAEEGRVDGINRVILCTDGDFNVGATGDALIELIEKKRDTGIYLSVLGFGSGNYNDYDLERLADHGNGNYSYIDSEAQAERVFRKELLGTLVVIAKDVKIQVSFDPAVVTSYRLLGYENRGIPDEDFEDPKVDTGDIGAGHDVTALLEVRLRDGVSSGSLATVDLRYKLPGGGVDIPLQQSLDVADAVESFEDAPSTFRFAAAVAEYAEILRHSEHAEGARFDDVLAILQASSDEGEDAVELAELVGIARDLWR